MTREAPDGLTFDIAYALIRALKIPRAVARIRKEITDDERRMMAQAVASYLMMANWDIRRGRPGRPPSTPPNWSPHAKREE